MLTYSVADMDSVENGDDSQNRQTQAHLPFPISQL